MQLRGLWGVVAVLCVGLSLFLVACGGGGSSDASAGDSGSGIPDSAPKVEVPEGVPPKKLVVKDLGEGTGAAAKKGDEVALQYNCVSWDTGGEYSDSWDYGEAPTFVLGEHFRLLRGLNLAVPGMKKGGGREVLVPNTLLYYPSVTHSPTRRLDAVICKVYLVDIVDTKRQ
jgi:peptidylprolyl isomerase